MGFNPYNQIRRARMTRWGDALFLGFFLAVTAGAIVWALS